MSNAGAEPGESHAYFRAIEETFIRLRGSPLLLSPADWQIARGWHERGIPLDFVCRALETFFEARRERGVESRMRSLRYCAPAVEEAWREVSELTAAGRRVEAAPLDVAGRLEALARALPPALPEPAGLAERIRALEGDVESVERALAELDSGVLRAAETALSEADRASIAAAAERGLAALAERLTDEEIEIQRQRLRRQALRRRLGLPVLSLFSPEARAG